MALSYAGVQLPVLTSDVFRRIEATLPVDEMALWAWSPTGPTRIRWTVPGPTHDLPQPKLGHLYWPTGASRWAIGLFVATDEQLGTIQRTLAGTSTQQAASLVLADDQRQITAQMYLLPPRSLQGVPGIQGLWLLPLVDQRYWWWMPTTGSLTAAAGQTWSGLYSQLAALLGITIQVDTVPAAYLTASPSLTSYDERIPPLLDTIAYNCGQRVVCDLNGTVHAYNRTTSQALQVAEMAQVRPVLAGGAITTPLAQPRGVQVDFSRLQDGSPSLTRADVLWLPADLGLVVGPTLPAVKEIRDTCVASFTGATWANKSECSALARQISLDWYGYQLGSFDISYAGVADYRPHGQIDCLDWTYTRDMVCTRVFRDTYNDRPEDLYHAGSVTSGGGASGGTEIIVNNYIFGWSLFWDFQDYNFTWINLGQWDISGTGPINFHVPVYIDYPLEVCGDFFACCTTLAQWTTDKIELTLPVGKIFYLVDTASSDLTLHSIVPHTFNGVAGPQLIALKNISTYSWRIQPNSSTGGVVAAHKIQVPHGIGVTSNCLYVKPDDTVWLWYDTCNPAGPQWYVVGFDGIMGASGPNSAPGLVPDPGTSAGTTRFLREDATWAVPPGTGGGGGATLTTSQANLGSDATLTSSWANTSLSLSLAAGTWAIDCDVYGDLQASFSGSANAALWARLHDGTNPITGTDRQIVYHSSPGASGQPVQNGGPLTALITLAGTTTITLQGQYVASVGATVSTAAFSAGQGTYMRAIKTA